MRCCIGSQLTANSVRALRRVAGLLKIMAMQGDICYHGADSVAILPGCMRAAELGMPRPQAAVLDWRSLWQVS